MSQTTISDEQPQQAQCNICGWSGAFLNRDEGRAGWHCGNCAAFSRMRFVMYGLGVLLHGTDLPMFQWPVRKDVKILESSARGPYPMILTDKVDYYAPEFDPQKIAEGANPCHYSDFQDLKFGDNTFDFVIATDVFEHVRDDVAGFRELFRVLKPGGSLLLTVPYEHDRAQTIRRVDTSGQEDVHLMEPEYHGGGGQTLAYRFYGRDLLTLLHSTGFAVGHLRTAIPAYGIVPQSLVIATKADYVELASNITPSSRMQSLGMLLPHRFFLLYKFNFRGFLHYWKEVFRK